MKSNVCVSVLFCFIFKQSIKFFFYSYIKEAAVVSGQVILPVHLQCWVLGFYTVTAENSEIKWENGVNINVVCDKHIIRW